MGKFPVAVTIADFNHDGKADLAVCNATDNTISVLLGNGDGSFQAAIAYPAGQGTSVGAIATGDFNEDHNRDIVATVSLTGSQGGTVALLAGNGDGTFAPVVFTPSDISPEAIAEGDLNQDGHADIFLGGNGTSAVLLGNGDGSFQTPRLLQLGAFGGSPGVAIGDVNQDAHPDLIGLDDFDNNLVVLLGNGDGTFQPPLASPVLDEPFAMATGDFNRDGKLDAMTVQSFANFVSVLLGNGDGTFQSAQPYFAGFFELSGAVADLNGDGKLDIVVGAFQDSSSQSASVAVLKGKGDGTFAPAAFFNAGPDEWAVATGKLNPDRKPDVVVTSPFSETVNVLLNTLTR